MLVQLFTLDYLKLGVWNDNMSLLKYTLFVYCLLFIVYSYMQVFLMTSSSLRTRCWECKTRVVQKNAAAAATFEVRQDCCRTRAEVFVLAEAHADASLT